MNRKAIGMLIANIFLCCGLIAELNWWSPKEIPLLKGYIDSHSIAINQQGKAIAIFNEKILGSYDAATNQWSFVKLNTSSEQMHLDPIGGQENIIGFSSEMPCKGTRILLNDYNQGMAVFRVSDGPNAGKIGCVSYLDGSWGQISLLSDEEGCMPVIAQSSSGGILIVWINKEEGSEDKGSLMSSYYNGSVWENYGVISQYKSVKTNYNQSSLQLGIDDMDDAIVVWKVRNNNQHENARELLVVCYFDGMQGKWMSEEVLAEQPEDKTGMHLAMNNKGDVFVVWESYLGVEGGFLNLSQHMLKNYYGIKNLGFADWTKGTIAQGEESGTPKVAVDQKGNGVALWLEGYSGMNSAYFNATSKSWERVSQPLSSKATYANAIQANADGKFHSVWIGEGDVLQEIISGSTFDYNSKTWRNVQNLNLKGDTSSLVDTVESFSLAGQNHGMIVWYDFFKEQLFYASLKEGQEPIAVEAQENQFLERSPAKKGKWVVTKKPGGKTKNKKKR